MSRGQIGGILRRCWILIFPFATFIERRVRVVMPNRRSSKKLLNSLQQPFEKIVLSEGFLILWITWGSQYCSVRWWYPRPQGDGLIKILLRKVWPIWIYSSFTSAHHTDTQAPTIGLIVVDLCLVLGFPSHKLSVFLSDHSPFKHLNGDILF